MEKDPDFSLGFDFLERGLEQGFDQIRLAADFFNHHPFCQQQGHLHQFLFSLETDDLPQACKLSQNFFNPFNKRSRFSVTFLDSFLEAFFKSFLERFILDTLNFSPSLFDHFQFFLFGRFSEGKGFLFDPFGFLEGSFVFCNQLLFIECCAFTDVAGIVFCVGQQAVFTLEMICMEVLRKIDFLGFGFFIDFSQHRIIFTGTVIHRFETVCFDRSGFLDGDFAVEVFQFEGFELRAVHGGWTCG